MTAVVAAAVEVLATVDVVEEAVEETVVFAAAGEVIPEEGVTEDVEVADEELEAKSMC